MTTELLIASVVLLLALAFFAFLDSSGQPPEDENEDPQVLTEDDFNGDT
jgi:hypothetical protein